MPDQAFQCKRGVLDSDIKIGANIFKDVHVGVYVYVQTCDLLYVNKNVHKLFQTALVYFDVSFVRATGQTWNLHSTVFLCLGGLYDF